MKRMFAAASFLLCLASGAAAQAPPAEERANNNDIVIEGERLREMVREFVGELAVAAPSEDQMSRWDRRVCPLVAGIAARHGQFIADRIAQRANAVGLRTLEPGCRANIVVLFTDDSDRLARELVDTYQTYMGALAPDGVVTLGAGELEAFASEQRPVRWWLQSRTTSSTGEPIGLRGGTRQQAMRFGAGQGKPRIGGWGISHRTFSPSRLRRGTRQDLLRAVVIVDARRAEGVRFAALADYLAMVSLAQVSPDADTGGAPSILNLFDGVQRAQNAPQAMTEWDAAYLEGLYGARRTAPNDAWQRRDIQNHMEEALTPGPG